MHYDKNFLGKDVMFQEFTDYQVACRRVTKY